MAMNHSLYWRSMPDWPAGTSEPVPRLQGNRAWPLRQAKVTVGISYRYIVVPEIRLFVSQVFPNQGHHPGVVILASAIRALMTGRIVVLGIRVKVQGRVKLIAIVDIHTIDQFHGAAQGNDILGEKAGAPVRRKQQGLVLQILAAGL